jgi:hypothetical protein
VTADDAEPVIPGDGGSIPHDDSPAGKPWTHRNPFKR